MTFQPPRGTRDFLPEEMIKRQYILSKIIGVFEKWGFDPLETPAFEDWELLAAKGGDAVKDEIYYFKDKSDRELGLRFEFTASLARVFATNLGLPKPFRRYQVGPVWRYDRPGAGRYREFWQADVDVLGAPPGEADALCIAVACDTLKELGFRDFFIRINNRKISKAFIISIGLEKNTNDVLRSIDKLEKIGKDGVTKELKEKKIPPEKIKKILEFITIKKLTDVKKFVEKEELGKEGIAEMEKVLEYVDNFGFIDCVRFDVSLIRGLEYYTGPVFEVSAGINVSVGGGGRYDNMIEGFGGKPTPATGISLGIDRLVLAMEESKLLNLEKTKTKIYLANIGQKTECIRIAKELIAMNISTEFDLMERSLSKQLDYANSKSIPFVIVLGEKEISSGKANLRDMKSGKENEISLASLEEVKKFV